MGSVEMILEGFSLSFLIKFLRTILAIGRLKPQKLVRTTYQNPAS
jgi:hypothetical protein